MGMLRSQTILHGKNGKSRLLTPLGGTGGEDVDTAEDHAAAVDVVEGFAVVVTVTAFFFFMKRRRRRRVRGSLFAEFRNGNVCPIEAFDGMVCSSDGWVVGKSAHHLCHHRVGSLAAPENVAAWKLSCVYACVCSVLCVCVYLLQVKIDTDEQGNAGLYTVLTCGLDAISSARGANAAATSGSSWSGILTWAWGCGCGIDIGMYVGIDEYEVGQLTMSLVTLMFGVRDNYIPGTFTFYLDVQCTEFDLVADACEVPRHNKSACLSPHSIYLIESFSRGTQFIQVDCLFFLHSPPSHALARASGAAPGK